MPIAIATVSPEGLRGFLALRDTAADFVAGRFATEQGATYAAFGQRGRDACREDMAYHLEFLQPVIEFGLADPMVEYLLWLASVLQTRGVPDAHLALSLEWLGEFFAAHLRGPQGAVIASALRSVRAEYETRASEPFATSTEAEAWPEFDPFRDALLTGSRTHATEIIAAAMARGASLVEVGTHVVQPALYDIGLKWQRNQVSVAQEHLATATAQSVMATALARATAASPNGRKVLLACVEGNRHAVGLQMVADAFQLAGWETQLLGADVPTGALVKQVEAWKPQLVGLSISFPHHLRVARAAIARLREVLGPRRPAIMVGGLAINRFEALAHHLGAEGWCRDSARVVEAGAAFAAAAA